jgi:hypothetical protein
MILSGTAASQHWAMPHPEPSNLTGPDTGSVCAKQEEMGDASPESPKH